jgi:hypothetical protein
VELSEREQEHLKTAIESIGNEFLALDDVKCPREKLDILLAVHKILVDGLTFPDENGTTTSQSSADLLLPVLIYRYLNPEGANIVSFKRIQRHSFRMFSLYSVSAQILSFKAKHPIV